MIPQTCKFKGRRFECGLSISCVLAGGRPLDLCSGGMIWSCCVDRDFHQDSGSALGAIQNASKLIVELNQASWKCTSSIKTKNKKNKQTKKS